MGSSRAKRPGQVSRTIRLLLGASVAGAGVLAFALALTLGGGPAAASGISGTWDCCGSGGAAQQVFIITGTTGRAELPDGSVFATIEAALNGDHVRIVTVYTGSSYVATFVGTLSGKSMSGSWTSNINQAGTWTASLASASKPTPSVPADSHPATDLAKGSRSTIAAALVPFDKAFPLSGRTLLNAALTIGVMLLITFPAQLFNKTLDENYPEIKAMVKARLPVVVTLRRAAKKLQAQDDGRIGFVTVMIVGSVIGGFNDPSFGLNAKSVETFIAVIASFVATTYLGARATYLYRRRRKVSTHWTLHALPAGLLIALGCAIVSRLTGFEPGYLYGVIAGVAFTAELTADQQGQDVALTSTLALSVAVISWIIWTPIGHLAAHPHPDPLVLIADTFFGGLFVGGIVGSVISLMPLQFLPGAVLVRWHKGAWAAVFGVAMFLMVQVMLQPATRSSRLGAPLVTTIVLFALFGGLSVAFNRYFARREKSHREFDTSETSSPDQDVLGATGRPSLEVTSEPRK